MIYTESAEQAARFARAAVSEMIGAGIPPHPQHFTVWYEYFAGRHAELCHAIDEMRQSGIAVSAEQTRTLYERFFLDHASGAELESWGARIEATAGRIMEALSVAGCNTAEYGAALQSFSGNIAGAESAADIRRLVQGILAATKEMDGHMRRLRSRVQGATQEITELREKLETTRREALTDALTGLANRKCFEERLEAAARHADETGEPLSLVLADIDHFKRFNDTYGHLVGDQVLRLVARTVFEAVRGRDTAARYGGEEFALILPNTPMDGAVVVAEGLRKALSARRLARKGSAKSLGTITLSFGASEYVSGEPLADLVRRVDDLLYRAKRLGRNRVIAESGPDRMVRAG